MPSSLWLCPVIVLCFGWSAADYTLTIMHTNDVHARLDQFNSRGGACSSSDAAEEKCYGGYPRLKSMVDKLRQKHNDSVLVDAGDQAQGTLWFTTHGFNITAEFMNSLPYDIMALGNHEFDLGPSGVEYLLKTVTFDVLSCNVDASPYPEISNLLKSHQIIMKGGQRVGFVGYTTVETAEISKPGKVTFTDEVTAVRAQVEQLTSQGVKFIVCVGHAGYTKDLRIAREVVGVDVVVGGHTNTFLYTGIPPDSEDPVGDYPTVVTRADGSKALVVQDYTFGKYLGFLQVVFDDAGNVIRWSGNPILLNSSVPRDQTLLNELARWRKGMDALANQTVGTTAVLLVGDRKVCRQRECNLGNVIADAMVMQNLRQPDGQQWKHVPIAIVNSGGIRASLEQGPITLADVLTVQPFRSTIDIVEVTGSTVRGIMEHSASKWIPDDLHGGFLQHSGLHVVYDMTKPIGRRVVDIKVKCAECQVPEFVDLEDEKVYKVILPSFLASGGDGYKVITENTIKHHLNGDLDSTVLKEYIQKYSPLVQGLEGRIRFVNGTTDRCSSSGGHVFSSLTALILIGVFGKCLSALL